MSQENVQALRDAYEWVRVNGTFPGHVATPDFIWDMSHFDGWPEQQVYEGVQGAEDFFTDWGSAWDSWEPAVEAMHDAGDKGRETPGDIDWIAAVRGGRARRAVRPRGA